MPTAWLVLPTYNEALNLERFVAAVLPQLAAAAEPKLLIVDDESPDGTGAIADRLAAADPRIEVLHNGAKGGLARAYLAGFRRALEGGADLILEMDADFSHDPADLPRLVEAAQGADLVIGSRYVRGGGVSDWSLGRRLLSRGGSLYARTVLGVGVRDLTGGYKCFRRGVLETLDFGAVRASGYGFQVEMTYRTLQAGFAVTEVPITFSERRLGTSKMTAGVALEAIWQVPLLRFGRRRAVRASSTV